MRRAAGATTTVALTGAAIVLAAGACGVAARAAVRRIRRLPDPVPPDRLRREPLGATTMVSRPDGTRLRVVVGGHEDAPTVVLAHGIALTLQEWNLVWDLLIDRGYRVVTFDQRGHGRSTIGADGVGVRAMAADCLAVLEATGTSGAILVGHSMGGFLALQALLDLPGTADRLAGLVLAATFAGDVLKGAPQNRAEVPVVRSHLATRLGHSPTASTLFAASFFGPKPSPAMLQALLDMVLAQDLTPLLPLLEAFTTEDLWPRLGAVRVPTVVVCGRSDRATPPRDSARLVAGIRGSRVVWVEHAGHMLPWEAPATLVDAVHEVEALVQSARRAAPRLSVPGDGAAGGPPRNPAGRHVGRPSEHSRQVPPQGRTRRP